MIFYEDSLTQVTLWTRRDIMSIKAVISILLPLISVASCQFLNCDWVQTLNCTVYGGISECGTDGITYPNRCYFAKAQCIDKFLHIVHDGDCQPWEVSTTPKPGSSVDGEVAVLDFFCTALAHMDCPTGQIEVICGTNGWNYQNYCEYDKARCTHRDLHIQNFGPCASVPAPGTK